MAETSNQTFSHIFKGRNIAIVMCGTFRPTGGMYEYARAWVDLLTEKDWNVTVIGVSGVVNEFDAANRQEVVFSGNPVTLYRRLALWSLIGRGVAKTFADSLIDAIARSGASVVHIVDRTVFSAYLVTRIRKAFPDIEIVVTIHDPKWHEERISKFGAMYKRSDDNQLVALSNAARLWIHVHDWRLVVGTIFERVDRLIDVPHPYPRRRCARARRSIAAIESGTESEAYPVRIGFMGRIESYKGLDILLDALLAVQDHFPDISGRLELLIAGRGDIALNKINRLRFPVILRNEFIPDLEFHQLVADLDVMVLPYLSATQSGVGMMGLTYGIPLVATDVGALSRLVIDGVNGRLVMARNVSALSDCLSEIVASPVILAKFCAHYDCELYREK